MANTTLETQQTAQIAPPAPNVAAAQDLARFTKKRPKKKLIFLAVLVIGAGGFVAYQNLKPKSTALAVNVTTLERSDLVNMINVSGTVESANASKVYSALNGVQVREIKVEEGAQVQAGDVLAILDTTDIELSIAQQKATMTQAEIQNAISLAIDEKAYNDLVADLQAGKNNQLVSAQQAVEMAQRRFTDAGRDVTEHKDDMEYADDTMNQLERDLNKARVAREKADKARKEAKRAYEANPGDPALKEAWDQAELAYNDADVAYDEALRAWNKGNNEYGGDLTVWSKTYRQERLNYQAALENKEVTEQAIQRQLENLQNSIERTRAASDMTAQQIALKKLQMSLDDAVIRAPAAGTVTAVYAQEGGPGSGLMFVVEDTEDLVVKTKIREYDIAAIQEGMPTVIKSDATRETEYEGTVRYISPTAVKSETGDTKTGSVEFATDIGLAEDQKGLRVGMNVRLNIILDKKENIMSVPYDSVATNEEGKSIVYVVRPGTDPEQEGKLFATPIEVQTGLETDFYMEISSADLAEGDQIIADPTGSGVTPGTEVVMKPSGASGMSGMMAG